MSYFNIKNRYFQRNNWKDILDKMMFFVGLIGPFMMIPQILKIYFERDASSIALTSWVLFSFVALCWTMYGLAHKNKVIVVSNFAWMIAYVFVIIGAIMY